jgi:hypothetical protein
MENEKRRSKRFLVRADVVVVLRHRSPKIGKVRDIGMGGLSFEHIHAQDLNTESSERDISLWVNDFSMSDLPCRIVYDIPISSLREHDFPTILFKKRRCGVKFETLTENQIAQLDFFLKTRTKQTSA